MKEIMIIKYKQNNDTAVSFERSRRELSIDAAE